MLVYTEAPIIEEEFSNISDKQKKYRRKTRRKQAGEKFKGGYTRFKEAGGLPVIENLLGLSSTPTGSAQTDGDLPPPPPPPPPPKGLSTTQKWMIGLGVAAVLGVAGYFIYKRYAGGSSTSVKKSVK